MTARVIPVPILPFEVLHSFIVQDKRSILVDTGVPGKAKVILNAIKRQGIEPTQISLILITHAHADHMGSAKELQEYTNAPVAIHHEAVSFLQEGHGPTLHSTGLTGQLFKHTPIPNQSTQPCRADIVLNDELNLAEFGVAGRVIATPGHTAGDVSVVLENKEIIAGDLLGGGILIGGLMRQHIPAKPPFQDDQRQVAESLQRLLEFRPTKFFIGHGGPLTTQSVQKYLAKI